MTSPADRGHRTDGPAAPSEREPATPSERDGILDAAILRLLLTEFPAQLTGPEIAVQLGEYGDAPGAVEDGLRRLVGTGLVHRHGRFVSPSRAALYFDELPVD